MESPGLVFPNAPSDVLSNGADNLLPLLDNELPNDFEKWCEARVDAHWPAIRDEMHAEWSKDARKSGNWHDYSMEVYRDMCVTALRMHMEEVLDCQTNISEDELKDWRNGVRPDIPAHDARTKSGTFSGSPFIKSGESRMVNHE